MAAKILRRTVVRVVFYGLVSSVLIISGIATRSAVTWIGKPFVGFLVNERMVLGNLGQYHWTGTKAGLRYPDRVVRADGREMRSMSELDQLARSRPIGEPIRYLIDRRGELNEVTVATMRFSVNDFVMTFGITCVSGLMYLLIGALVYVMRPDRKVSWVFFLACYFLSVFAIASFDIQSTHAGFVRLYLLASGFFPAAFMHFGLLFPERWRVLEGRPYLEVIPYVLSAGLIMPLEVLYPRPEFVDVYLWVRLYAIVAAIVMLMSTVRAYLRTPSALARQRARVVCIGALVAFPVPAVAYYLSLFGGEWVGVTIYNNFLALPILFFPAAVAYAVARHNLFDVDVYIKRAVGYGGMTVLVSASYVAIQALTRRMILEPVFGELSDRAYPFLFGLLVVWLFNPVLTRFQRGVDRLWFRTESDYKRTVIEVSSALRSMLDRKEIMAKVADTVKGGMFLEKAGVVLIGSDGRVSDSLVVGEGAADRGRNGWLMVDTVDEDPMFALVRREKRLITRYDLEEDSRYADVRETCVRRCAESGVSMVMPLLCGGEAVGIVVLGERKSGRFYSRAEIDLLSTLADQAAVAVENASSHAKVVNYAAELAASLRRIEMLEVMKASLAKFVPQSVQRAIEASPEAPLLDKREVDVTVLFADISEYTRLIAGMELARADRLVERYFGAFLDEIVKFGGDVNETAGDGLMVIFQQDDPTEHARAAVRAALAIQRRTAEINEELRAFSEPVSMHVGVNSGVASVGATKIEGRAGIRWTYTASGTTTNVAARLAALAQAGAVVLSEETRRRVSAEFEAEDLGVQSLKNVAAPVRAYRIIGERIGGQVELSGEAAERRR